MNTCEDKVSKLPSIEMYGGDTTPWEIVLLNENHHPYTLDSVDGYSCTLTMVPFAASYGTSEYAAAAKPVLSKVGTMILSTLTKAVTVSFEFDIADTLLLRGKYTYQIEVFHNQERLVVKS